VHAVMPASEVMTAAMVVVVIKELEAEERHNA
jgi:hypothetical protein